MCNSQSSLMQWVIICIIGCFRWWSLVMLRPVTSSSNTQRHDLLWWNAEHRVKNNGGQIGCRNVEQSKWQALQTVQPNFIKVSSLSVFIVHLKIQVIPRQKLLSPSLTLVLISVVYVAMVVNRDLLSRWDSEWPPTFPPSTKRCQGTAHFNTSGRQHMWSSRQERLLRELRELFVSGTVCAGILRASLWSGQQNSLAELRQPADRHQRRILSVRGGRHHQRPAWLRCVGLRHYHHHFRCCLLPVVRPDAVCWRQWLPHCHCLDLDWPGESRVITARVRLEKSHKVTSCLSTWKPLPQGRAWVSTLK